MILQRAARSFERARPCGASVRTTSRRRPLASVPTGHHGRLSSAKPSSTYDCMSEVKEARLEKVGCVQTSVTVGGVAVLHISEILAAQ